MADVQFRADSCTFGLVTRLSARVVALLWHEAELMLFISSHCPCFHVAIPDSVAGVITILG